MGERREVQRVPAFVGAIIGFSGRYRLRCLVQNLSKAGAKLVLEKSATVPDTFTLKLSRGGVRVGYQAQVKWRSRTGMGVEFATPSVIETQPLHGFRLVR
jgi:hypothetical protein